jgi:hypothetical protein
VTTTTRLDDQGGGGAGGSSLTKGAQTDLFGTSAVFAAVSAAGAGTVTTAVSVSAVQTLALLIGWHPTAVAQLLLMPEVSLNGTDFVPLVALDSLTTTITAGAVRDSSGAEPDFPGEIANAFKIQADLDHLQYVFPRSGPVEANEVYYAGVALDVTPWQSIRFRLFSTVAGSTGWVAYSLVNLG